MTAPFALGSGDGERIAFSTGALIVRASAEATGGAFSALEEVEPLLDTPLHVHEREDELMYVLEGEHVYRVGDQEFPVGPGGVVFMPKGVPHAHRRVVPGKGRLLCLASPAGFEGFFRTIQQGARDGLPEDQAYAIAAERYGITWLR